MDEMKKLFDKLSFQTEMKANVYTGGNLPAGHIDGALEKIKVLCEQDITSFMFAATMRDCGEYGDNEPPILVSLAGPLDELLAGLERLATQIATTVDRHREEEGDE